VVSSNRLDVRHVAEGVEGLLAVDVSGVNDQVDPPKALEQARGELIRELRVVRIRHDSDALGHAEKLSWRPATFQFYIDS
jgi:hypothetical protein